MIRNKIATIGLSLALVLGAAAPASAVTVAELQAQINALMAQLSSLQGSGAGVVNAISSDLTVGSSGNSVVTLQQALVAQGYLTMPAGVSMGYFGSLTKSAVMKWQAAMGLPSTGFFGPMSRAKFNAGATGTVPGTTVGGTVTGSITTPGVEGTLTVTKYASPASGQKLREGASKVAALGIKLEAKTSDIKIERVKLDLGSATTFYRKIAEKVYIMDGSTVLASADLNSSTVIKDGSNYYITLAGFGYVVPKDSTKVLTVAFDAADSIDTADQTSYTITVPMEGVRGVDGAGINQYGPSSAFSNSVAVEGELAEDATLTVSTNSDTPKDMEVICSTGTDEDECDQLSILKADFKAEKDAVTVTDLVVDINMTGADTATATVAYLYDGSTLVGSESIDGLAGTNDVTFDDIDWTIPSGSTKTLTVKLDVRDAQFAANIFTADIDTADVTSENSNGDAITESGSATGESITVRKAGLEVTLLSKSITKEAGTDTSTSSLTATFKLRLKAVGAAVEIGDTGSTTYAFADQDSTLAAGESFAVYKNGSVINPAVSSSTTMTLSSSLPAAGSNSYKLSENNTVDVDVTYSLQNSNLGFGAYAVGLQRLNWLTLEGGRQTSTFMSGETAWRTGTVTLP